MELSSIELRYLINEINSKVTLGYYVSNIKSVTEDSFIFRLHHSLQPDQMLVISVRGIWLTKLIFNTIDDNDLVSTIRGELERSKIVSVEQIGSERIVKILFRTIDGRLRTLVGEFFGQGNIVLCDEEMKILYILNPIEVRHRTLKIGFPYVNPPLRGTNIFNISFEELQFIWKSQKEKDIEIDRWIGRNLALPKKYVEETLRRAEIKASKVGELQEEDLKKIYFSLRNLIMQVTIGKYHEPIIILGSNGSEEEVLPIITENARKSRFIKIDSYMEGIDRVLGNETVDITRRKGTIEITSRIANLEHDLVELNKAKEVVISKAAAMRNIAKELMSLSYQGVQNFNDQSLKPLSVIKSVGFVEEKGIKYLEVAGERVELESNLPRIASILFTKAKEMEHGNNSIEEAKKKLLDQIDKLQHQTVTIKKKIIAKHQINKDWFERYRWFITSDGLLTIGGRDSSSNSTLIRRHLKENDIVFHAEIHGSPFFIIKDIATHDNIERSLAQAAQATVSFSRAWSDGLFSADAYWIRSHQIKKAAPAGQFLPKGSFIVEGKRNYIKGIELRVAIGIIKLNDRYTLICGSVDAIRERTFVYAILLPGGVDDTVDTAKKIKSELLNSAAELDEDLKSSIKTIMLDDFIRTIPYGKSKISFVGRGYMKSNYD